MIYVIIGVAIWLIGIVFGWSLCRVAALSDRAAEEEFDRTHRDGLF